MWDTNLSQTWLYLVRDECLCQCSDHVNAAGGNCRYEIRHITDIQQRFFNTCKDPFEFYHDLIFLLFSDDGRGQGMYSQGPWCYIHVSVAFANINFTCYSHKCIY